MDALQRWLVKTWNFGLDELPEKKGDNVMKRKVPEELNSKTPQWFRDWHDKAFWHFKYRVENRLDTHSKLLWGIVIAVIAGAIVTIIFG